MDYGRRFKRFRVRAELTQKEAAELIGIKDYQLANYETNRSEPSLDALVKMSKIYKVSLDKLLGTNVNDDTFEDAVIKENEEFVNKLREYCEEFARKHKDEIK